jgi:hypothetical protein
VFQESLWQLLKNPCFRTPVAGKISTYNGSDYTRKVINSTLSGHTEDLKKKTFATIKANAIAPSGYPNPLAAHYAFLHPYLAGSFF